MNKKILFRAAALVILLQPVARAESTVVTSSITWENWSDDVFVRAKQEHRLVILDLEAVWCHWCHVMDTVTYQDPAVIQLMGAHFIAVRVDQDSRPDISNRYERYGWPATILFDSNGQELAKRSGYIPPKPMASMLQAFVDDPTPGPSAQKEATAAPPSTSALSPALRKTLVETYYDGYDAAQGSWGTVQKYLEWNSMEYALVLAKAGDARSEAMAKKTLRAEEALRDPVWGGVYQYSTSGIWTEPHFEKIMSTQAENLRIYALAYAQFHDPKDLAMAQSIERYLRTFLKSPDGAFYTSQDADVIEGKHRVDTHEYARENGWVIRSLTLLYTATGDASYLNEARTAAERMLQTRALPDGGFRHDAQDAAGPYLGDTLAMGRAFLELYTATAERAWLTHAEKAAHFMDLHFKNTASAGYVTAFASPAQPLKPNPERDENIALARFANLLFHVTGQVDYRRMAETAMRYVAIPAVAQVRPTAGVLLADAEMNADPLHITIEGKKKNPKTRALFMAALQYPSTYRRIEWWDPSEAPLANADTPYPVLKAPAAFICVNARCSLPISNPADMARRIDHL